MALTAAIIGGGLAIAGAATAAKGARTKGVDPRLAPYQYGGSSAAAGGYRDQYGKEVGLAQTLGNAPLGTYGELQATGQQAQQQGSGVLTQAFAPGGFGGEGGADVSSFDPQGVARMQAQAATSEAARRTNAIGRTGGALGLRAALGANANAGVQTATQAAVAGAQGEQARAGLELQRQQQVNATRIGLAGLGLQEQGLGAGIQQNAAGAVTNLGLAREGMYNTQLAGFEDRQLQAQIAHEQARQQAALDKRRLLVGLGAGLIGAGGTVASSGMSGGGGK